MRTYGLTRYPSGVSLRLFERHAYCKHVAGDAVNDGVGGRSEQQSKPMARVRSHHDQICTDARGKRAHIRSRRAKKNVRT